MARQWHYREGDQVIGPLSAGELRLMAADGTVVPDTMIRMGTVGKWVAASCVKGLFEHDAAPPLPTTPTSSSPPTLPNDLLDEVNPDSIIGSVNGGLTNIDASASDSSSVADSSLESRPKRQYPAMSAVSNACSILAGLQVIGALVLLVVVSSQYTPRRDSLRVDLAVAEAGLKWRVNQEDYPAEEVKLAEQRVELLRSEQYRVLQGFQMRVAVILISSIWSVLVLSLIAAGIKVILDIQDNTHRMAISSEGSA